MNIGRASLIGLLVASLASSGCALLLVGAGVAGGYAISKDSVRNVFDLPQDVVYSRSLQVAKQMGLVMLEDRTHGQIKAKIQDVNIHITVKPLTKRTIQLIVRGRNNFGMPQVDVAQEVYNKIIEQL